MTKPTRLTAALTSLLLLGSLLGTPAALATGSVTALAGPPVSTVGGPAIGSKTTTYYDGYSAYLFHGSFSRVTGTWVVSKATCSGVTSVMFAWVGMDDNGAKYLEQAGTGDYCIGSSLTPHYYAWYEMFPKPSVASSLVVRAGDTIRTTVSVVANTFTFKIENLTTHLTFTKAVTQLHSARLAAYWIVESPWNGPSSAHLYPLTKFAPFTIGSAYATAAGHTRAINASAWNLRLHWTMASGRTIKATSGGLKTGTWFSVAWHHL